jgi:WD40 repeat protein
VAFTSGADNLAPGVTNLQQNVYVRDLQGGTTVLVSVNSSGAGPGNAASYSPLISSDGSGVLFRSKASNLAAGSFTSGTENLFFRSLTTATTYPLTTGGVVSSSMTPDGSRVAFSGEINGISINKVYVWNSQTGGRIYTNSASSASCVAISPNGQWITYATNGSLHGVNVASGAAWLIGPSTASSHPGLQFSRDSRFIACAGALNNTNQVFLYDSLTGSNTLVSQSYGGSGGAAGPSDWPAISPDGRFVVYRSAATNLTANSTAAYPNLFLYDRFSGATALLTSSRYASSTADNRSLIPVFSGDGQTLLFQSWAADLAAQDGNQASDVFAYPMPTVTLLPAAIAGQGPTLTWPVIPNLNYQIQFKNNLTDPLWQNAGAVTIIGNQGSFVDPLPNPGQRFYRLVIF